MTDNSATNVLWMKRRGSATTKLDIICQKLALSPRNHLVESGTGWGGHAGLAASGAYCLRVKAVPTTVSVSR